MQMSSIFFLITIISYYTVLVFFAQPFTVQYIYSIWDVQHHFQNEILSCLILVNRNVKKLGDDDKTILQI